MHYAASHAKHMMLVAAGGATGATARYLLDGLAVQVLGNAFPFGTIIVNLLGSFVLGVPGVLSRGCRRSPIEHEVSGFLADEPEALRGYAQRLLEDRELAHRMGEEARQAVARLFPADKFAQGFRRAIHKAQRKWRKIAQTSSRRREARV